MNLRKNEWNRIISEHFDITDHKTRKVLLSLNEEDKTAVLSSLSAKLYHIIIDKSTEIDYGDIPKSKGDISKIPKFTDITECLNTIRQIVVECHDNPEPVDTVLKAIDNLRDSKSMWEKAYVMGSTVPIVFYETIALAIVSSTSFMISTSIDYIKEPTEKEFIATLDKTGYHKSKDALLYRNLRKFNKAYKDGDIKKTVEPMLKMKDKVSESVDIVNEFSAAGILTVVLTAGLAISLLGLFVQVLHELVCFFYCTRQNLSEYYASQAELLAMNAETVKLDYTKTEAKRDQIYKKQMKIVDRLKKISNKLAVKLKSAEAQGEKMYREETSKKYKIDDVADDALVASAMF